MTITIPRPRSEQDEDYLAMRALVRERIPPRFLEQTDGVSGEEIVNACARVGAELRRRKALDRAGRFARTATGGERAVGTITIAFEVPTIAAYTVAAGQVVATSKWGLTFELVDPIARAAAAVAGSVTVAVRAAWEGSQGNVPQDMVRDWALADDQNPASLEWDAGADAGKAEFLAGVRSGAIAITLSSRMEGGRTATLDLIAAGRGQPRVEDETDDTLRLRIAQRSQDAVTPNGILRAVNKALGYDGATMSKYWQFGFAWGVSGWGLHGWGRRRMAIVFVPEGEDIVALQALVDSITQAGNYILVLPQAAT